MLNYESLSEILEKEIISDRKNGYVSPYRFCDEKIIRRDNNKDRANIIRPAFVRDTEKIVYCPYYNRYADKTQVFSFYKNDDITRRGLHVQLVSRIARNIGSVLGLNLDLIEAISLGHDIGHAPFGHAGERFLDLIFHSHTGRHFSHNIHSVRVLDKIFPYNISLQTLNGIAAHDGEMELSHYSPKPLENFSEFDAQIENCYTDKSNVKKLIPMTLEGCVMRISDIIAYLGKDRQDAETARIMENKKFEGGKIGTYNAEIINNLIVNIIENSYKKPYIKMDDEHFEALKKAKSDNNRLIYQNSDTNKDLEQIVNPIMEELYEKLLSDLKNSRKSSPVFTHHIDYINSVHYKCEFPYEQNDPHQIVTDYIAGMTDDYLIDLYGYLFPKSDKKIIYKGYFD